MARFQVDSPHYHSATEVDHMYRYYITLNEALDDLLTCPSKWASINDMLTGMTVCNKRDLLDDDLKKVMMEKEAWKLANTTIY